METFKKTASAALLALCICAFADAGQSETDKERKMKYPLTELEYATDALEPTIDAQTVALHHDKHQAAYVEKLNAALASEPLFNFDGSLDEL